MLFLNYYLVRPPLKGEKNMQETMKKENLLIRATPRKLIPLLVLVTIIACITAINLAAPVFLRAGGIGITLLSISIDNADGDRYTAKNSDAWDAKYLANQKIRESLYNSSDEFVRTMSTNKGKLVGTFFGTMVLILLSMYLLTRLFLAIAKEILRTILKKIARRLRKKTRRVAIKRV